MTFFSKAKVGKVLLVSVMMVTCDFLYGAQPQAPYGTPPAPPPAAAPQQQSRFNLWNRRRSAPPSPSPQGGQMELECSCKSKQPPQYGAPPAAAPYPPPAPYGAPPAGHH